MNPAGQDKLLCMKQLGIAATTVRRWRRAGLLPPPVIVRGAYLFPADAIARAREEQARRADARLFGPRRGRGRPRLDEGGAGGGQ